VATEADSAARESTNTVVLATSDFCCIYIVPMGLLPVGYTSTQYAAYTGATTTGRVQFLAGKYVQHGLSISRTDSADVFVNYSCGKIGTLSNTAMI
jgi:hypothetical protein